MPCCSQAAPQTNSGRRVLKKLARFQNYADCAGARQFSIQEGTANPLTYIDCIGSDVSSNRLLTDALTELQSAVAVCFSTIQLAWGHPSSAI